MVGRRTQAKKEDTGKAKKEDKRGQERTPVKKGTRRGERNNSHKQHKQQQIRGDIPLKIM